MRRLRSLRVQEQAAKAPIKLLLPLMLFFLPAVFLILFGPVFLKLSEIGF
jgi:tight adherence protein C